MTLSHEDRIRSLADDGNSALLDLVPMSAPLKDIVAAHNHKRALMLLSTACFGYSQTVLYLVRGLRLWEAEIVGRAIFEGTVKFAYMLESPSTLNQRCEEYSEILPTISKLRWHTKAEEALRALGDDGSLWKKSYRELLLSEAETKAIRDVYPRELRQSVERRWGYTELVTTISKLGGAFGPSGRSSLHGYMLASHLVHMTHEGVDLPLERDHRSPDRREAIAIAHAGRLVSDCFELAFFRAIVIRKFLARPLDDLTAIRKRHESLFTRLEKANDEFSRAEYGDG